MSQIFTVFGATGNQGGSVIDAILSHPELSKKYKLRGVTRDVSKPAAQALAARGVEVVAANLDDAASVAAVINGASVVFGVTNYWEKASPEVEWAQGKAIADASAAAKVSHLIWSSLPNVTELTNGHLSHVLHFDTKAKIEAYIRELSIPSSFIMPALFMAAFALSGTVGIGMVRISPDDPAGNTISMAIPFAPTNKMPMIDPRPDVGKFVAADLLDTAPPSGKRIFAAEGIYTPQDIQKTLEEVTGKKVVYTELTVAQYQKFLPPSAAEELGQNMTLIRDYAYYGPTAVEGVKRAVQETEAKGFKLTSFKDFLQKNSL